MVGRFIGRNFLRVRDDMKKTIDKLAMFVLLISGIILLIKYDYILSDRFTTVVVVLLVGIILICSWVYYQLYRTKKQMNNYMKIKKAIFDLTKATTSIENEKEFFDMMLQKAVDVVGDAEKGSLMIQSQDGRWQYVSSVGFDLKKLQEIEMNIEETILYKISKGLIKETQVVWDIEEYNRHGIHPKKMAVLQAVGTDDLQSTISSPIFLDHKLYGMINVDSTKKHAFSHHDVEMISYFALEASKVIKLYMTIDKMLKYARYDYLTGIYNRQYLEKSLLDILCRNCCHSCCFLSIDLNDLKMVNDRYGHTYGDRYIITFAHTVAKFIGEDDLFARYGGDEFVLIFLNKETFIVEGIMGQIFDALEENPIRVDGENIYVSFCYGMANYPDEGQAIEELFSVADEKMYLQKKQYKRHGHNEDTTA